MLKICYLNTYIGSPNNYVVRATGDDEGKTKGKYTKGMIRLNDQRETIMQKNSLGIIISSSAQRHSPPETMCNKNCPALR